MNLHQTAKFLTTLLAVFVLPSTALVLPSVLLCQGCLAHHQQHVPFPITAAAPLARTAPNTLPAAILTPRGKRPRSGTSRLRLRRDELPEENRRQLEAADKRVKELEEEYWKSLDAGEVAVERKCASGLVCLKMGMLERAAEDYTQAAELRYVGGGAGGGEIGWGRWLIRALSGTSCFICRGGTDSTISSMIVLIVVGI